MRAIFALVLALLIATPVVAGDLTVRVRDAAGQPVRDAVVTVHPAAGIPDRPIRFPWQMRVIQQDVQFQPHVLIVPKGATVTFPNLDRMRHHVYSFSRGNRFEIELFGRDQTRSHAFNSVGVAAIGCNIHDQMLAYIKVVDTPWAAKTPSTGDIVLRNIPTGGATLTVWHPRLAVRANETSRVITVGAAAGRQTVTGDFSGRAAVR
ncbi:MAG TPA: methylamine utilization protein [Brevundimonas sp.]|nr:methylamine utilization protein [Brevundimonas sp.]